MRPSRRSTVVGRSCKQRAGFQRRVGARAAVVLVAPCAGRRGIAGDTGNGVLVCLGQALGDERAERQDEGDGGWCERAGLEV